MYEYSQTTRIGGPPMEVPEGERYLLFLHKDWIGPAAEVDRSFVQEIVDAFNAIERLDTERVRGYIYEVRFFQSADGSVVRFWFDVHDPPTAEQIYAEHMKALNSLPLE